VRRHATKGYSLAEKRMTVPGMTMDQLPETFQSELLLSIPE